MSGGDGTTAEEQLGIALLVLAEKYPQEAETLPELLTAALNEAKAKGRAIGEHIGAEEQMKADCAAMCSLCSDGRAILYNAEGWYWHGLGALCDASAIRRACAE